MSFADYETSTEQGGPVELYEFRRGPIPYRYTSSQNAVTLLTFDWTPIPISRSSVVSSSGDNSAERLEIRMPASAPPISEFVRIVPGEKISLTVRRYHTDDPDQESVIIFQGAVQSVAFVEEGRVAEVHVAPITIAKSKPLPRITYQGLCNHLLYDARCKLSEHNPDFEFFFNCSAQDDVLITLDGAGSEGPSDAFEMGFLEFNGEFRMVVSQSGDDLTIQLPFSTDPVGSNVRALFGCKNRIAEDCRDKFDNVDNFGGFPYVPFSNPFESGID